MRRQDPFGRVLVALGAAALDDARWPAASGLIDELCGAKGNMLVTGDGATDEDVDILFARFCFRGERHAELEREYFEVWHALDERLPRIRRLPEGRLAPVPALFGEDELKTSALYNELMPRTDTRDSLTVRMDGPDGSCIVWTIADPVGGDGWTSARAETIEALLPHLRQFVRVRAALVDARALGSSMVELLDNVRTGVVQLDRRGRVVAANDAALALLREGDGLSDRDGVLRATRPEEDAVLQGLIARALPFPGGPGGSGSMRLSRAGCLPRLLLHVSPVHEASGEFGQGRIGALVLAVDPAWRWDIDPERVADLLGLTPAESRIAVLLAQGRSIDEVASETGRGRNTVKWHIRHIYAKHGLSRQAELMRLVGALAYDPRVPRRALQVRTAPVRPGGFQQVPQR